MRVFVIEAVADYLICGAIIIVAEDEDQAMEILQKEMVDIDAKSFFVLSDRSDWGEMSIDYPNAVVMIRETPI